MEVGADTQTVFKLISTRGWESVEIRYWGASFEAATQLFRAQLVVETRFWDRSDAESGELDLNASLSFQPILVEFSSLHLLRKVLQEWCRSRSSFEVELGAPNFSLILTTIEPVGIQQDHQQAFKMLYRSENELTALEQVVVSDTTVVDQILLDLNSFLDQRPTPPH